MTLSTQIYFKYYFTSFFHSVIRNVKFLFTIIYYFDLLFKEKQFNFIHNNII